MAMNSSRLMILLMLFFSTFHQVNAFAEVDDDDFADYYIEEVEKDHFEGFNRAMLQFNHIVDSVILKPITKFYQFILPEWCQERVDSVLRNMAMPVSMMNYALQGKRDEASTALGSFITNSIVGLGGVFDVASLVSNRPFQTVGFSDTLQYYDVKAGSYLVLPFLGPSSPRNLVGKFFDIGMNPFTYALNQDALIVKSSLQAIAMREKYLEAERILGASVDEYYALKSLYVQKHMQNNKNIGISNE